MKRNLRIIFMGTPEFAVPSLEILIQSGYKPVAVVTAPDKPRGRGRKISMPPVKETALKHKIPVLQPTNLKSREFEEQLEQFDPNLQIVVAFRMLPEIVWNYPEYGTFNLHASLLPQYRGAAPINWVIINGEDKTGVTTFFLKQKIDTGNIIFQEEEPVLKEDTAGSLYERLRHKGAGLVLKTVHAIESGDYKEIEQPRVDKLITAPKIFKETCRIDWNNSAWDIYNFVRGLSPYPGAWTKLNGKTIKIFWCRIVEGENNNTVNPGDYKTDNKSFLNFKCGTGWIHVEELQVQGKRRMKIEEFLRGNPI